MKLFSIAILLISAQAINSEGIFDKINFAINNKEQYKQQKMLKENMKIAEKLKTKESFKD